MWLAVIRRYSRTFRNRTFVWLGSSNSTHAADRFQLILMDSMLSISGRRKT
jgi:hypothetical protein